MTAVSLFDVLSRDTAPGAPAGAGVDDSLPRFAERLVTASLADLERVREYEETFVLTRRRDDYASDLDVLRSVWRLYKEWADEAEQVFARARAVSLGGGPRVAGIDRLDDALGRVQARLALTPEQVARAKQQMRDGYAIPATELRDELHARIRTRR